MTSDSDDLAFGPLSEEYTRDSLRAFWGRCEIAAAAGGICECDRQAGFRVPPEGWWLDDLTMYWLPPGFRFGTERVQ